MPLSSALKSAFTSESTNPHPDRRTSPRYDLTGPVFLLLEGMEPVKIGTVRDISLSGAYVLSHENPPDNELLRLQFRIGADFEMSGHVCRKEAAGFAVHFDSEA